MIDPATLPALPGLLSAPRFERYSRRYAGRSDLAARLYAWNTELTTAFWGPVGCLEVFVRNAVHDSLRRGRRDDWWNDPSVRLLDRERRAVDDAVRTLNRRGEPDPSPDRVVAATSFGLWVGLTDGGVPRDPLWSYETTLWQPRIVHAFPGLGHATEAAPPPPGRGTTLPQPARAPRTDPRGARRADPRRSHHHRGLHRSRRRCADLRRASHRRGARSEAHSRRDRGLGDLTGTPCSRGSLGSGTWWMRWSSGPDRTDSRQR